MDLTEQVQDVLPRPDDGHSSSGTASAASSSDEMGRDSRSPLSVGEDIGDIDTPIASPVEHHLGDLLKEVSELFSENVTAKLFRSATEGLKDNNPPTYFPEFVPQTGDKTGLYILREADFWTCGFFPGTLYSLLERSIKFPKTFPGTEPSLGVEKASLRSSLHALAETWSGPIHAMASRTDTHDMSFIIQPSLRPSWELLHKPDSLGSILQAARSLATRYNPVVGALRSWDVLDQQSVQINSLDQDFLVIIDSMCNLDLLFYAGYHTSSPDLISMAIKHAKTLIAHHFRPEKTREGSPFKGQNYSTIHVVNFNPEDGEVKGKMTAQGYKDTSTWARGQAWGVMGYALTYNWCGDTAFLEAACGLAEHFIARLEGSPDCVEVEISEEEREDLKGGNGKERKTKGRYVPLWDFDAPIEDESNPLRDSSAGVIAANGMLVLSQTLATSTSSYYRKLSEHYLSMALKIISDTLAFSLSKEKARFAVLENGKLGVEDVKKGERFDAILKNATANHNSRDWRRYWDHGLVYADYYLVEFGNRLLRMGLA